MFSTKLRLSCTLSFFSQEGWDLSCGEIRFCSRVETKSVAFILVCLCQEGRQAGPKGPVQSPGGNAGEEKLLKN